MLKLSTSPCCLLTGHVSAEPDSAEETDPDVAVDEEEDEEEVLVEEDQIQNTVCIGYHTAAHEAKPSILYADR